MGEQTGKAPVSVNLWETVIRPRITEIIHLIRTGSPEWEVSERLGISRQTLTAYKKKFPEFAQAIKDARRQSSIGVESALYRRATGYEFTEFRTVQDGDKITITTTTKHVPADVIAAIFWLKNREPGYWQDKQKVENEISVPTSLADVVARRARITQGNN